jgi:crotonobetainyl-CoA:carnitine CoA-transferase CaiB-like acyl-CoA transferase
MAPHGAYPCRDGDWISIAVGSDDKAWRALTEAMAPRSRRGAALQHVADRKANESALDRLVAQWTAGGDALELAASCNDLAWRRRGEEPEFPRPGGGPAALGKRLLPPRQRSSRAIQADRGPALEDVGQASITDAAPRLGQHNAYVLGELLGLSEEEQRQLAAAGITR